MSDLITLICGINNTRRFYKTLESEPPKKTTRGRC